MMTDLDKAMRLKDSVEQVLKAPDTLAEIMRGMHSSTLALKAAKETLSGPDGQVCPDKQREALYAVERALEGVSVFDSAHGGETGRVYEHVEALQ